MTRSEILKIAKPILFNTEMVRAILDGRKTVTRRKIDIDIANQFDVEHDGKTVIVYINPETGDCYNPTEICKYQPGDILYVRETWTYHENAVGGIIYKARCPKKLAETKEWHPSIHMPKEAARIFLRVTDVRVARLNDMQEEDAINEGFPDSPAGTGSPLERFSILWDKTLKPDERDAYGWWGNPWVWVIEFERMEVE